MNVNPVSQSTEVDKLLQEYSREMPIDKEYSIKEMEDMFCNYMAKNGWQHMIPNFFED